MLAFEEDEQFLIFRVGPVACCAAVRDVDAIVNAQPLHKLPQQADFISGVFLYRESTVSVVNMFHKFALRTPEEKNHGTFIMAHTRHGIVGFWVDEVIDIVNNYQQHWADPPAFIDDGIFDKTLLWQDKLILLTDFNRLFAMNESIALSQWANQSMDDWNIADEKQATVRGERADREPFKQSRTSRKTIENLHRRGEIYSQPVSSLMSEFVAETDSQLAANESLSASISGVKHNTETPVSTNLADDLVEPASEMLKQLETSGTDLLAEAKSELEPPDAQSDFVSRAIADIKHSLEQKHAEQDKPLSSSAKSGSAFPENRTEFSIATESDHSHSTAQISLPDGQAVLSSAAKRFSSINVTSHSSAFEKSENIETDVTSFPEQIRENQIQHISSWLTEPVPHTNAEIENGESEFMDSVSFSANHETEQVETENLKLREASTVHVSGLETNLSTPLDEISSGEISDSILGKTPASEFDHTHSQIAHDRVSYPISDNLSSVDEILDASELNAEKINIKRELLAKKDTRRSARFDQDFRHSEIAQPHQDVTNSASKPITNDSAPRFNPDWELAPQGVVHSDETEMLASDTSSEVLVTPLSSELVPDTASVTSMLEQDEPDLHDELTTLQTQRSATDVLQDSAIVDFESNVEQFFQEKLADKVATYQQSLEAAEIKKQITDRIFFTPTEPPSEVSESGDDLFEAVVSDYIHQTNKAPPDSDALWDSASEPTTEFDRGLEEKREASIRKVIERIEKHQEKLDSTKPLRLAAGVLLAASAVFLIEHYTQFSQNFLRGEIQSLKMLSESNPTSSETTEFSDREILAEVESSVSQMPEINLPVIGRDPLPVPLQGLQEIPVISWQTHIVIRGDTLWDISEFYLKDPFRYPDLARWSGIKNPDLIYPGDEVKYKLDK